METIMKSMKSNNENEEKMNEDNDDDINPFQEIDDFVGIGKNTNCDLGDDIHNLVDSPPAAHSASRN